MQIRSRRPLLCNRWLVELWLPDRSAGCLLSASGIVEHCRKIAPESIRHFTSRSMDFIKDRINRQFLNHRSSSLQAYRLSESG